jgi:hypothetical protein
VADSVRFVTNDKKAGTRIIHRKVFPEAEIQRKLKCKDRIKTEKSMLQASESGQCSFIIPSAFLQAMVQVPFSFLSGRFQDGMKKTVHPESNLNPT